MKVVAIHGDDEVKKRERFFQIIDGIKRRGWAVEHVGKNGLLEAMSRNSLFPETKLFIIDEAKDLNKKDFDLINSKNKSDIQMLLYSKGLLTKTVLNKLPKGTKVETFTIPKILFKFLETLYPDNAKASVNLLDKLLETESHEMVLAMVGRHLRDLAWAKEGNLPYPSWRAGKLKSQSDRFSKASLKNLLCSLADFDVATKTSKLPDPKAQLDLIILKSLG